MRKPKGKTENVWGVFTCLKGTVPRRWYLIGVKATKAQANNFIIAGSWRDAERILRIVKGTISVPED